MTEPLKPVQQCKSCPWRIDCDPDTDIPNYVRELHEKLEHTIAEPGSLAGLTQTTMRMMACHYSKPGEEFPCAGWLHHQIGDGNNIAVRLRVITGKLPPPEIDGPQHARFEDTRGSRTRSVRCLRRGQRSQKRNGGADVASSFVLPCLRSSLFDLQHHRHEARLSPCVSPLRLRLRMEASLMETFIANDVEHEIVSHSDHVPMWFKLRCNIPAPPQFGPSRIGNGPVTCLSCIGWVEPEHDQFCRTRCTSHRVPCPTIHSCWCSLEVT